MRNIAQMAMRMRSMAVRKKPIQVPMSSTHAQRQFGAVLRRVHSGQEHIVVEQNGLPLAVMISIGEYEELMKERERREAQEKRAEELSRKFGDEAARRGITEEQLLENLQETRRAVYQEKYAGLSLRWVSTGQQADRRVFFEPL
jgi:prevent-host-death family protein